MDNNLVLSLRNIKKIYPGVVALDHVNIDFRAGEVHALCGENGAGKSTLIKVISGAITPEEGTIIFEGKEFKAFNPELSNSLGIHTVYQELNLVPGLSVAENMFLGNGKGIYKKKEVEAAARKIFEEWNLNVPEGELISNLTVGYQQLVEITRAISHDDLKVVIFDEPTAPLTEEEVDSLFSIIAKLKEKGVAVIYISHRMEEIFKISDKVTVMRDGEYIASLNTAETNRQELIKLMVGRELTDDFPKRETPVGEELLKAENLSGNGLTDISFNVHKGEIVGFAGLLGCGRTELMELIAGVQPISKGKLIINGKEVHFKDATQATALGINMITEDRKAKGFFGVQGIDWNITISCLPRLSNGLFINNGNIKKVSDEFFNKLNIKASSPAQFVSTLSGGNQQKVVIAKSMSTGADILIFDEPTRGIDVGAKAEIYKLIRQFSEEGKTILLVSSEMKEVIGLCDKIVVLSEKKQAGTLEDQNDFTQEKILELATKFS